MTSNFYSGLAGRRGKNAPDVFWETKRVNERSQPMKREWKNSWPANEARATLIGDGLESPASSPSRQIYQGKNALADALAVSTSAGDWFAPLLFEDTKDEKRANGRPGRTLNLKVLDGVAVKFLGRSIFYLRVATPTAPHVSILKSCLNP